MSIPQPSQTIPAHDPAIWLRRFGQMGFAFALLVAGLRFAIFVRPRAMEFDQVCTLFTVTVPSWRAYLAVLPVDAQPPFSHAATLLGLWLPLPQAVGVHSVSLLMAIVSAACLYRLFERRGAPLAGLVAAAWFTASRCMEWTLTVRPYAALIAVAALSLLSYDTYRTRRAHGDRCTLWPLALCIVLGASVHALGVVFSLAPVIVGEALYLLATRRVDKRLLLASLLASTSFLFDFELAHQVQKQWLNQVPLSARLPGLPTPAKLAEVLLAPLERRWQLFLLPVLIALTLTLWFRARHKPHSHTEPAQVDFIYPFFAAASMYAAGALAFVMGHVNHYFFTRYASPVYLCSPLLLGAILSLPVWRRFRLISAALSAFLLLLPLLTLRSAFRELSAGNLREDHAAIFAHPLVVASPLSFPTLWWYATPAERARLQLVTDPQRYKQVPDGVPEATLRAYQDAGALPFRLTPFSGFHPKTEVYVVHPLTAGDLWLTSALAQRGFVCAEDSTLRSRTYSAEICTQSLTSGN